MPQKLNFTKNQNQKIIQILIKMKFYSDFLVQNFTVKKKMIWQDFLTVGTFLNKSLIQKIFNVNNFKTKKYIYLDSWDNAY